MSGVLKGYKITSATAISSPFFSDKDGLGKCKQDSSGNGFAADEFVIWYELILGHDH